MGIAVMEELVSTVGAILKTLECPICLELLKTPVSAGCGHFFCRHCVSGILQSNYRAPCPLCKRSFTRRSVQAASQRQTVISAAKTLAQTCSSLTGFNFTTLDSFVKESCVLADAITPVPSKKFRASNEKAESASSRKRKSDETEDVEKTKQKSISAAEMETHLEPLRDKESSKKRACPAVEDDEDSGEDLPSLEEIFSQCNPPSKSSDISVVNETAVEKPLSIFPADRVSALKTYSSVHRKKENSATSVRSKSEEKKESYDDYFISSRKNVTNELGSSLKGSHCIVQVKNKINALMNKTNKVHGEKLIQGDGPASKPTNVNQKMEPMDKSKENEVLSSPSIPPSVPSPVKLKQSGTKRLRRSKRKSQTRLQNSASSKNISSNNANLKNSYTLHEVTLPSLECENQNEQKKSVEDPFKSMGLTDTAISVDSVGSPLAGKTLSMLKSPGWSRVKEVKKDFKVKKFTSLHVEKNSPSISHKTAAVSDQEPNAVEDKSELPTGIRKENKVDSACENATVFENEIDQGLKLNEGEDNNEDLVFQNENVPEPINLINIEESDSHMEVEKQTSRCNRNHSKNVNPNSLKSKEFNAGVTKLPSVSITSNSVICANYTDSHDKISKHNVMKTKKIICEVPNNSLFNNDGIIFSKYIQDNCPEAGNALLSNPAEIKQGAYPLPSQISGYQSFQAHSVVNENDSFQYVEQSQQTSQMFNFDLQNSVLNKFNSIVEPRVFPHNVTKEKTKVVKRTCLTLEEIQDCFLKSSQSNCSETLCSVPFLDGFFKLHIGVSDDTLNVSVLKVIEPSSDINNAQSELLNKYIQTSNTLLPLPAILPSSNAGSESSQPESAVDPFPYLNTVSGSAISSQDLPLSVEKSVQDEPSDQPHETNFANSGSFPVDQPNCEEEINENNMDMSEIIHFPPKPTQVNQELVQNCPESVQIVQQAEVCEIEKSPLKEDLKLIMEQSPQKTNYASMECDLPRNDCKDLPSKEVATIDLDSEEFSNSDQEESLKKLEKCVYQTPKGKGKKVSRLSLKKKSFKTTQVLESSDESDLENSRFVKKSIAEVDSKVSSKSDKPLKLASPAENMRSSGILGKEESLKPSVHHSVTGETPTSNSLLSEDAPETNASEIILEIEDLADKIKSLEERLNQCGHADLLKSVSLPQVDCSKRDLVHEASDSEDSSDLFPQSVPPTPPNRV